MSTLPTLTVEAALNDNPTVAPTTWTDLTAWVEAIAITRGRQDERSPVQVGTATVTLDNRDRRFDPSYTAGPYYALLKRRRRMRIRASWDGLSYDLFSGFVERWPQAFDGFSNAFVDVPLSDGLAILATKRLIASYPQERSDLRIGRVLDDALWTTGQGWLVGDATYGLLGSTTLLGPVGDRALSQGQSTIQASTLGGTEAVNHLRDVERSENGLLFVSAGGGLVFQSRLQRVNPVSVATFGDRPDSGELPYVAIGINDDTPLANEVTVTRQGGTPQTASDSASQASYFPASLSLSSLVTTDAEALDAANWLLQRYAEPTSPRISRLVLHGQGDPARLWPVILSRELGDCLTAVRRPPGDPTQPLSQVSWLEGISHRYRAADGLWETTFALSPADTSTYWLLDNTQASLLGSTTRLGY